VTSTNPRERGSGLVSAFLGVGLYTVPEASRLTRVSIGRIRRWARGYSFVPPGGERRTSPPVWRLQYPEADGVVLTFRDLIEIRAVNAFLEAGVSWNKLRRSAQAAVEIFGGTHPLSSRRFKTDGERIFAELLRKDATANIIELADRQYVFRKIVDEFLFGVTFLKNEPSQWWPLGEKRAVVLDPSRAFGQPIVAEGSVQTRVLAGAFAAEGSYDRVARWYGVPVRGVKDSVEYEKTLTRAA
jgi:uncharacterized protein (DUF433 family)